MSWRQGKQLFSEMSLCTECGDDKCVEVEMASLEVGILGALHDKTGIMQLTIRTKHTLVMMFAACPLLDSLPQDHIMNLFFALRVISFCTF